MEWINNLFKRKSNKELALEQLKNDKLIMKFSKFHKLVQKATGRPITIIDLSQDRSKLITEIENK